MKKIMVYLAMSGVLFGLFARGTRESDAVVTTKITIAHVFQTDHPVHVALTEANEMLQRESNGRFALEIFPNGTYANYNDAIQAVIMGQLDMCPLDSAAEYLPEAGVVLGPYVFQSYTHWNNFKQSDVYEKLRNDISDAVGVKQLAMYNFGFRNVTGNRPLVTLDDYKRLKFRVVNFPPYSELATIFDCIATSLPIGDVYMGLQSGVVDAEENPLTQIATMKFYEVQKYLMLTRHMLAVSGTIMNETKWNGLSADDQALFERVFKFEADRIDQLVQENEAVLIEDMKTKGMIVIDNIDTKPFRDRVPLVLDHNPSWVNLYNQIQQIPSE